MSDRILIDVRIEDSGCIAADEFPEPGDVIECDDALRPPEGEGPYPTRNVLILSRAAPFDALFQITSHRNDHAPGKPCEASRATYSETISFGYQRYVGVYTDQQTNRGTSTGSIVHSLCPETCETS